MQKQKPGKAGWWGREGMCSATRVDAFPTFPAVTQSTLGRLLKKSEVGDQNGFQSRKGKKTGLVATSTLWDLMNSSQPSAKRRKKLCKS
jgi:hypothetical protein